VYAPRIIAAVPKISGTTMRLRTALTIPKVEKIPALPLADGKDGVDWGKLDSAQKVASSKTDVPHLERSGNVSPVQCRLMISSI
jgi:hypothetical protein